MSTARQVYLAVDLGASSGRVVAGLWNGQSMELCEVHRFANAGVPAGGRLYWDLLHLWRQVLDGLTAAAARYADQVVSVGVDTWGVDFGLLGDDDQLLANPLHYRDRHTEGILDFAFSLVSRDEIFRQTGLQFMPLNTLFQLLAMKRDGNAALRAARRLLLMPDLFHWLLSGEKSTEQTNVSTTQLFNPRSGTWAQPLIEKLQLPGSIFGEICQPGTNLGPTCQAVRGETGLPGVSVVIPASHDTASAVLAVPNTESTRTAPSWCYISSGTWSLMGVETAQPMITPQVSELNFTNEAGVGGTTRLLKNIAGLWLVQECRRIWNSEGADYSWDDLTRAAEQATPLAFLVDPDHHSFVTPLNMPQQIQRFCSSSGQMAPSGCGAIVRCALESLAMRYRMVLEMLQRLLGTRLESIHVIGGGSHNRLLCQMTADACRREVVAGPAEATALGNVMMQAVSHGAVSDRLQARGIIGASVDLQRYQPRDPGQWDDAYPRFCQLVEP